MEKKVIIGDKEYTIKEICYVDMLDIDIQNPEKRGEAARKLLKLSTGLSDEEVNKITIKDGMALQNVINEVNGLGDFTEPIKKP